jgi:hypothetical protein
MHCMANKGNGERSCVQEKGNWSFGVNSCTQKQGGESLLNYKSLADALRLTI